MVIKASSLLYATDAVGALHSCSRPEKKILSLQFLLDPQNIGGFWFAFKVLLKQKLFASSLCYAAVSLH